MHVEKRLTTLFGRQVTKGTEPEPLGMRLVTAHAGLAASVQAPSGLRVVEGGEGVGGLRWWLGRGVGG